MLAAETSLPGLLKLLADPTRLRILALIDREELAVRELSRALGLAQSRVSNHLRHLREAGLLVERHAGSSTYLRLATQKNGAAAATRLWETLREELDGLPEHAADLDRLAAVLAARAGASDTFFDRVAGSWDKIGGAFRTGQARQRAGLHLLPPGLKLADLGCGTGYMAHALLGHCSEVICVDRSNGMLDAAQERLQRTARSTKVELRQGALDALPIETGEVDGVVAGMVLHHLPELDPAIAEMRRILRPGGTAVVLDLDPHREVWMQSELGDRHLGLSSSDVLAAFRRAGFEDVSLDPVDDHYQPRSPSGDAVSLSLFIVRGRAPQQS